MEDIECMHLALAEAQSAAAAGEAPVGAVLVSGDEVIAAAHNQTISDHDPSGHAEIVVLRKAGQLCDNHRLVNTTLFVTLEPCAMCVGAIAQARIARVVFGAYDEKAGALGSAIDLGDSPALNHRFEIQGGVLADECAAVLQAFFRDKRV